MSKWQITKICFLAGLLCLAANASAFSKRTLPIAFLNMDGIHATESGVIYAAEGFRGSRVFAISEQGITVEFAGGLSGPIDITQDSKGNLYVTNFNNRTVSQISPEGVVSKFADVLDGPAGIVIDEHDNLYVSHYGVGAGDGDTVLKISPNGEVSTFSKGNMLSAPVGTAIDPEGNVYTANFNDGRVLKITPQGEQSLLTQIQSEVGFAIGHLAYANGRVFASNPAGEKVFVIRRNGKIRERGKVPSDTFPNGITFDKLNSQVLFINAFAPVSAIQKIKIRRW